MSSAVTASSPLLKHSSPSVSNSSSLNNVNNNIFTYNSVTEISNTKKRLIHLNKSPSNSSTNSNENESNNILIIDSNNNNLSKQRLKKVSCATTLSLVINIVLLLIKITIVLLTNSLSVIASLVDSGLDLTSQFIMFITEKLVNRGISLHYPAGTTRLEPISIMIVSMLMIMASTIVLWESVELLISHSSSLTFDYYSIISLISCIILKIGLYWYCKQLKWSPIALALSQDHINDVLSNSVAVISFVLASKISNGKLSYIFDSTGAIIISLYIIYTWLDTGILEIKKLIGKNASNKFLNHISYLCNNHHKDVKLDIIRGYHIGRNILVEVEIIMPKHYTLNRVHDISLNLQNKIEKLNYVERAFVHVDYKPRNYNEHKIPTLD